jgi:hypothetical protein
MWARIPYSPVGDVGVYQSAEIKFALALLRLRADPATTQPTHSCCLPCSAIGAKPRARGCRVLPNARSQATKCWGLRPSTGA